MNKLRFTLLMVPVLAIAGDTAIRGPISGFVLDADGLLRPAIGVPGAAVLGAAVDAPALSAVGASPQSDWAIGITRDDGQVLLIRDGKSTPLDFLAPGALRVSTISGAAAVAYADHAAIVTGLPDNPVANATFDLPATPAVMALADDSASLAIATGDAVYVLAAGVPARKLADLRGAASIAFLNGGRDLAYADAGANQVSLISDIRGGAAVAVLARPDDGVDGPVGLGTLDRALVVAQASGVLLIATDNNSIRAVDCACTPTGVTAMAGGGIFRLTDPSDQPARVIDLRSRDPRLLYLPLAN